MRLRDTKLTAVLFIAIFIVSAFAVIPTATDGRESGPEDISISPSTSSFTLSGGESRTIYLDIHNKLTPSEEDDETLIVYIDFDENSDLSISFPSGQRVAVKGGEIGFCEVLISTDMYAPSNVISLSFTVTINDPDRSAPIKFKETDVILITVESNYGSETYINKFLGLVENNLDGVFGQSWFAAIITFIAYLLIGDFICFYAFPYIVERLRTRKWFSDMFPKRDLAFEADKILFVGFMLITMFYTLRVYGLSERMVGIMYTIMMIYFIIVAGVLVWNMFNYILNRTLGWFDDDITDGSKSSVYSLLLIIGRIAIVVGTVMAVLVTAGVESTAAALVSAAFGLALSFGAQSTVEQLFSGLVILVTKPFSVGDVVRLEDEGMDLKVIRIGLMNTKFKEWNSQEIHSIPNSQLAQGKVINITAEKKTYIMQMYFPLPTNVDFELVYDLFLQAAAKVDHIVLHEEDMEPELEVNEGTIPSTLEAKFSFHIDDFSEHDGITTNMRIEAYKILRENGIEVRPVARSDVIIREAGPIKK